MKKLISILVVAIATLTLTSCHRDQMAIQKLNDVVTNLEQQYEQMSDEDMDMAKAQYAKALEEIAKYRYSQADNELIGAIKARYDKAIFKYEILNAKRDAQGVFEQIVGYGKELINVIDSL